MGITFDKEAEVVSYPMLAEERQDCFRVESSLDKPRRDGGERMIVTIDSNVFSDMVPKRLQLRSRERALSFRESPAPFALVLCREAPISFATRHLDIRRYNGPAVQRRGPRRQDSSTCEAVTKRASSAATAS